MATTRKPRPSRAKKHYWAVKQLGKENLFEGSHLDCWQWLVINKGGVTLQQLYDRGISLARMN